MAANPAVAAAVPGAAAANPTVVTGVPAATAANPAATGNGPTIAQNDAATMAVAYRNMTPAQEQDYRDTYGGSRPMPRSKFTGIWKGGRPLGAGTGGITCLWVQVDANDHILDRVCLKDCQMDFVEYTDPEMYLRDRGRPRPREFVTQRYSMPKPPAGANGNFRDHIVNVRSSELLTTRSAWRIYTEFCDHGDLDDLIREHFTANKPFTEPFLLWVLESLAYACENLQHPAGLPRGRPAGSEIVHQDIKMQNVFLAAPHPTLFRRHPFIKLGDFGAARLTHPAEPVARNPTMYRMEDFHTEGFDPHELHDQRYTAAVAQPDSALHAAGVIAAPIRLSAATNIWQVGRIILAMMRLETVGTAAQIDYYTQPRPLGAAPVAPSTVRTDGWVPDVNVGWPANANYSVMLVNLVDECLQVDVAARPTPRAVRTRCAAEINTNWAADHRDRTTHYASRSVHRVKMGLLDSHRRFRLGVHSRVLN